MHQQDFPAWHVLFVSVVFPDANLNSLLAWVATTCHIKLMINYTWSGYSEQPKEIRQFDVCANIWRSHISSSIYFSKCKLALPFLECYKLATVTLLFPMNASMLKYDQVKSFQNKDCIRSWDRIQKCLTFNNLGINFWFWCIWVMALTESTTRERCVIFLVVNGPWLLEGDKTGMSSEMSARPGIKLYILLTCL